MTLEQLTVLATIAGVIIAFFQFIGPLISPLWTLIAAKRRRYRKALRRAVRYVGLLWILLVTACCWWVWITNKSDGRLTNAQRLVLAAHDEAVSAYGAASEQYRKVLDSEKNCVLAHLGMGRIDFYTGLYTEAEHEYQQVLDVDPQNLDALQALALDQSDAKFSEYPQAIRTLNSLLSVDPHYSKGQYLLGLNYLRAWKARGDWDDTGPSDYFELAKTKTSLV
jgi:tetratricopeptide (TPR) repeat protein